jgi:hypothetical protein
LPYSFTRAFIPALVGHDASRFLVSQDLRPIQSLEQKFT